MPHFRRKSSSPATPTNSPPPTPKSPIEFIRKEIVRAHSKARDPKTLAASSSSIALSVFSASSDPNPSSAGTDEPGSSKESGWRMAYGAARMAIEVAKESSDMFLPLKAVVGALAVLIKNYDQTAANAEQMREIEERIQSLAEVLGSPVDDRDSEEKARRGALREKLDRILARLGPLCEQHGLVKFLRNADHANTLSGFVQDLGYAVTDYQTCIQQSIYKNTKRIDENTKEIKENTKGIDEDAKRISEDAKRIDERAKEIDENTRNIIEAADLELLGKLEPVHNAGHQAGHHDTCLRGTRENVLNDIMRWAKDPQERHVFWLNGLAGTGKSTIAQTFSGVVAKNGTLGASFFCSRDYLNRKELKNIFPTLAYQLACRYPAFRKQIIRVIKRDPSAAQNSLISQLEDLIVDPLSFTKISCVIVVDALDECVDDQPASAILSVLGRFVKQLPSVKFFITGRPEPRIRTGFRLPLLEPFTQIFLLHKVKLSSVDEDIRLYLQEKLTAVAKRRSDFDLSDPWPCDKDLTALTKKSSGLFIFASTLARFIESEHHEPDERLQLIVTLPDSTVHEGRAGIDPLYTQVLVHGFSDIGDVTLFANLRRVLGAVILAFNPLSRVQIAEILNIKSSLIMANLRHLHSVLLIPNGDYEEIRVFHKSFPDFLQDPDRCSDSKFFIPSLFHHADMALGCFELLKKLEQNPCNLPDFVMNRDVPNVTELLEDKVGGALRYACSHWAMHLRSSPAGDDHASRLITSATEFLKENSLPWIEVMSLDNRLEGVIHSMNNLIDWLGAVEVPASDLESLARDCLRFTMHFFHPIQQSASHIYHSALPLSPQSSMFLSMSLPEKTRTTEFYGRPDNWGFVVRTITDTHGSFACVATIGRGSVTKIAAACGDGTVHIYDSVTGVLRLSLSPRYPVQAMTGHPDGSILVCTRREYPISITLWDIQTGGLVHTFILETEIGDTAISLNGRYLACSLSDGTVKSWEVADRTELPVFKSNSPITCLCWLAPEEQLMVANEKSAHIRDIVTGSVLVHNFKMQDPICGAVYSQKLNQLAVVTGSGVESCITTIDAQTGTFSASHRFQRQLSCFTFSQTAKELVCGMMTRGLESISVLPQRRTFFDFPAMITSVSALSNGTVVANVVDSGIQLLSLNEGSPPSRQQLLPPTLTVHSLDEGRIIAIVPTDRDRIILLEAAAMSQVFTIPAQKDLLVPINRTVIVCASLEKKVAVRCFSEGVKEYLQLWEFNRQHPQWTVQTKERPSIGGLSPTCALLVTFHKASRIYIRVWSMLDGRLLAEGSEPRILLPHKITFGSEDVFHSHHDTCCIHYNIAYPSAPASSLFSRSIIPCKVLGQTRGKQHRVDDNHEWVVSGSQRICWIPPGCIGSAQASHCWAGFTLVMAGQDGTIRKLTLYESSL